MLPKFGPNSIFGITNLLPPGLFWSTVDEFVPQTRGVNLRIVCNWWARGGKRWSPPLSALPHLVCVVCPIQGAARYGEHEGLELTPLECCLTHFGLAHHFQGSCDVRSRSEAYILHPTPYTLHLTPYIQHPTPQNPHPTPYTLRLLTLSLSLSLSLSHTHTHTHALSLTYTHTLSHTLSPSLSPGGQQGDSARVVRRALNAQAVQGPRGPRCQRGYS